MGIAVPVLEGAVGERPRDERQPVRRQAVGQGGEHRLHAGESGQQEEAAEAGLDDPEPPGVIGTRPMIPATA